jgi:hypothetical protein
MVIGERLQGKGRQRMGTLARSIVSIEGLTEASLFTPDYEKAVGYLRTFFWRIRDR